MTIPLAFAQHAATKPEQAVRRHLREQFRLFRLLPRIVTDIQYLLDPSTGHQADDRNAQMVHLWDPELGALPAGVNYAQDDE
jgi:CRISPR-associated protein Cas1